MTHRVMDKRIKAAAGTSLPIASPPVFRAAEGRPAAAQFQKVFATIEASFGQQDQLQPSNNNNNNSPATTSAARHKATLDALLQAFAEEKEAGRSNADKALTAFRIERTLAKDEEGEADRLRNIVLNAVARSMNEALSVCEAAAVNSLTVGKDAVLRSGGLSSCARGLVLPYDFFSRAVELTTSAVQSTFDHWVLRGHARVSLAADEAAARGVAHTTETLDQLEKSMGSGTAIFTNTQLERFGAVRADCFVALRAALVWRMLHQVQGNVNGMHEATLAFEELLPCLFANIDVKALPHMPSLGAQVMQLLRFPTLSTEIQLLRSSAEHLRLDAQYFRKAMQHWAVDIWFRQLVGGRRKTTVLERVGGCFDRLCQRNLKRKSFGAWKMLATRGRIARFVLKTSHELQDAMAASRVSDGAGGKTASSPNGGGAGGLVGNNSSSSSSGNNKSKNTASSTSTTATTTLDDLSCMQSSEPWTLLGDTALDAVKTLTIVCSAFRVQIARQKETIDRVESEREHLRDKVSLLESKLLRQIEQTNVKTNEVEKLQQQLYESRCNHNNANSRLLQQEHVPWRVQAMELIKQVIVVPPLRPLPPPVAVPLRFGDDEDDDEPHQSFGNNNIDLDNTSNLSDDGGNSAEGKGLGPKTKSFSSSSRRPLLDTASVVSGGGGGGGGGQQPATRRGTGKLISSSNNNNNFNNSSNNRSGTSMSSMMAPRPPKLLVKAPTLQHQNTMTPGERGQFDSRRPSASIHSIAESHKSSDEGDITSGGGMPLTADALQTQAQLFEADPFAVKLDDPELTIVRWVNQCLDDLQSLENNSFAAIAVLRCGTKFSWEWGDCLLLSRLLYYLALPKFATNGAYGKAAQEQMATMMAASFNNNNNNNDNSTIFAAQSVRQGAATARGDDGVESVFGGGSQYAQSQYGGGGGGGRASVCGGVSPGTRGGSCGGSGGAGSVFSSSLPSFRARSSFIQSWTHSGSNREPGAFSQAAAAAFGHASIASGLPSTKNADAVLDFSISCRAMLLDGSASMQVFTPEAAEKVAAMAGTGLVAFSPVGAGSVSNVAGPPENGGSPSFIPSLARGTALFSKQKQQQQQQQAQMRQQSVYSMCPMYQECFHDFSVASAKRRCEIVVAFAQELLDLTVPPVVVADVLSGQKSAILLLVALLYLKFAHPLSHGRLAGIEPAPPDVVRHQQQQQQSRSRQQVISSFDLFEQKQRQQQSDLLNKGAVSRTDIIAGSLWEVTCVDNPQVLREVCTWASAMRRSLDEHRWQIARELLFVDSIVGRDARTRSLVALRRQAFDDHLARSETAEQHVFFSTSGVRRSSGLSFSQLKGLKTGATTPSSPRKKRKGGGGKGAPGSPRDGSIRPKSTSSRRSKSPPSSDNNSNSRRSRSPMSNRSQTPSRLSDGEGGKTDEEKRRQQQQPPDEEVKFQRHCVMVFRGVLESCQKQHQVKAIALGSNSANLMNQSAHTVRPTSPHVMQRSETMTPSVGNSNPLISLVGGSEANATASTGFQHTPNLLEHIEGDICSQLDSALHKLFDVYSRRSVVEFESGGARGLSMVALMDLFVDAEITSHLISRDQLHTVMATERYSRDAATLFSPAAAAGAGVAAGAGAHNASTSFFSSSCLAPSSASTATFATSTAASPGHTGLTPTMSLHVPPALFGAAGAGGGGGLGAGSGGGHRRNSAAPPTTTAASRFGTATAVDSRLLSFDELLGIIARVSHLQIIKWSQERNNAVPPTGFRCQIIQRLSVLADSSEVSKFIALLDTVNVSERFSSFRAQLQELFDACATMPDDFINRMSSPGSVSVRGAGGGGPGGSMSGSESVRLDSSKLIITLDNFMKLVQESFMLIPPELVRQVFDEALRTSNLKSKRLSAHLLASHLMMKKRKYGGVGGTGGAGGGGGNSMNFSYFVRAVALLAHVHDPLPTVAFEDRLTRFLPMFCVSVRPVVLAMTRAKNQETDLRVRERAVENRTLAAPPLGNNEKGGGGGSQQVQSSLQQQQQQQRLQSSLRKKDGRLSPTRGNSGDAKKDTRDFLSRK